MVRFQGWPAVARIELKMKLRLVCMYALMQSVKWYGFKTALQMVQMKLK